ncbi:MAG: DNA mismatch repair protein MutS [Candidatus Omnitrophica bacterium]|nr:DNA mismatch repair protein MutS [Candidatus Omnitrophota bacterium]
MASEFTPMMKQYLEIKGRHKDAVLFFRLGDFYEMFFDDAREVTRLLHITLTSREAGKGNKVPMCGVPHHAAANYIARLIKHGKKVAICDQVEEPAPGKKIVKRDVTRIITPGTFMADELLDGSVNNYILSLKEDSGRFGLAYADISTGEFRLTEAEGKEDFISELYKISPSECLVPEKFTKEDIFKKLSDVSLGTVTENEDWRFDTALSEKQIKEHFGVRDLEGFGCEGLDLAVGAAGALLKYLKDTQRSKLNNIDVLTSYRSGEFMTIDRNSQRNLELIRNNEDLSVKGTLLDVLDLAGTPMGKRKLKRRILEPLIEPDAIEARLDAVEYFFSHPPLRKRTVEILSDIYDLERLANKLALGSANARDMLSLAYSLEKAGGIRGLFDKKAPSPVRSVLEGLGDFSDVVDGIKECISDDPPVQVTEGGIIKKGFDPEVDELRSLIEGGKDWILALKDREVKRTGISSLKVSYNKVFGYYIEVTKANLDRVPGDYIRKQTLVNSERFITRELKDHEARIIGAQDRIKSLEYSIFCRLRDKIAGSIEKIKRAAESVAEMDVASSLAEVASRNRYVRPVISRDAVFDIKGGRHPVLENILKDKEFVPNDILMNDDDRRIFIITGSNMAGKSTLIRQAALLSIMAQMGSFVPAASAEIGVVDRIFTRVGASDRLYRGMSTFMVEMLETANILNNTTGRSLVILDEIGRGTSTFDGVSIAWAVVEYLHRRRPGAKVLFATHYHELTELSDIMHGVKNYNMAVKEWGEDVVFLYKLAEGSCDESFGIHVAKLAGMPAEVVTRSREILKNLLNDSLRGNIRSRFSEIKKDAETQLDLFDGSARYEPLIEKLRSIDVNNMTPMEAIKRLAQVQEEIERT